MNLKDVKVPDNIKTIYKDEAHKITEDTQAKNLQEYIADVCADPMYDKMVEAIKEAAANGKNYVTMIPRDVEYYDDIAKNGHLITSKDTEFTKGETDAFKLFEDVFGFAVKQQHTSYFYVTPAGDQKEIRLEQVAIFW